MPLVVDASVVLARPLGEIHPGNAAAVAGIRGEEWVVPGLWWFEVRNGLVINERRQRLTVQAVEAALRGLSRASVTLDRTPDETAVMALARRHRLTVYDAAYLELALHERLPLATLDANLAEAARRDGVAVVGD